MQPRRLLCPRLLTVSHVIKSGYCSCLRVGAVFDRLPKEKNEELEHDFDEAPSAACDDVVEREEGVDAVEAEEDEGICNRLNEVGLRLLGIESISSSSSSSISSSSSMSMTSVSSTVVSGAPVLCCLYCSHNSST